MSYAMTHLIIANEYTKRNPVENKGLFLLASIVPDFVHARADFEPGMKERSHFLQENTRWGTLYEESSIKQWYLELGTCYHRAVTNVEEGKEKEFLQGYVLHILTDIFNCKILYAPNLIKRKTDIKEFRIFYGAECLAWDNKLYREYEESDGALEQAKEALKELKELTVLRKMGLQELLSVENIEKGLLWQIQAYQKEKSKNDNMKFTMISQSASDSFIAYVGEQSDRLLYDFPEVGRLFRVE